MNEEEQQAIGYLKEFRDDVYKGVGSRSLMVKNLNTIFGIIASQQKEIEDFKKNDGYHLGFIDGGIAKRYETQDKIKEKIEKYKNIKNNMTIMVFSKYEKTQRSYKQVVYTEVIRVLEELLEEL